MAARASRSSPFNCCSKPKPCGIWVPCRPARRPTGTAVLNRVLNSLTRMFSAVLILVVAEADWEMAAIARTAVAVGISGSTSTTAPTRQESPWP